VRKYKALVVDDSAYNRATIARMLESDEAITVVGSAVDGVDAIAKTVRFAPDVITLDLEMPNMDGFTFLRWLMKERPTPVIVLSSRSDNRSVFRAMELGAVEFLAKPEPRISPSIERVREDLVDKVHAVLNLEMEKVRSSVDLLAQKQNAPVVRKEDEARSEQGPVEVVAIAASTGGPQALQAILTALPGDLSAGVVIAQHMPAGFTRSFAERLNKLAALMVREAAAGDRVEPGTVLIAPGGAHLTVQRETGGISADVHAAVQTDKYVPSADRLLHSVAEACGPAALGVVLTGMGRDGAVGAVAIKNRGGHCLAESQESAVVFGMPKEAMKTGAIDKSLPLHKMAEEIARRCSASKGIH